MHFGIAGSAHLDILAQVTGDALAIDKVGKVSIEIGGTGANLAINLAKQGHEVKLLTAMSSSPYSMFVMEYLKSMEVTTVIEWNECLPLAAFCAQIDKSGELETAISSMPVSQIEFANDSVESILKYADAIILECNLPVEEISRIIRQAKLINIPTFLSAVSEEKVEKIGHLDRDNLPNAVFMNKREYKRLAKIVGMAGAPVPSLSEHLSCDLIVSNGNSTIEIGYANGDSDNLNVDLVSGLENTLGAGDSLMSSAIHYLMTQGVSWNEAISMSMETVQRVLQKQNCNLGEKSALENALQNLHVKAERDALTGLYNRGAATLLASRMFNESSISGNDLSAIVIDIDNFKLVNDTYGHDIGDLVIVETAIHISNAVRSNDIAARWGGEEFVCLLPGNNIDVAVKVAERIRHSIESGIISPRQITVSIGVASLKSGMKKLEELIKIADQALYSAKQNGRNMVCTYE